MLFDIHDLSEIVSGATNEAEILHRLFLLCRGEKNLAMSVLWVLKKIKITSRLIRLNINLKEYAKWTRFAINKKLRWEKNQRNEKYESFQSKLFAILLLVYRTIDKQSKKIGFKDWINLSAVDAKYKFKLCETLNSSRMNQILKPIEKKFWIKLNKLGKIRSCFVWAMKGNGEFVNRFS